MKFIINENQHKLLIDNIESLLNDKLVKDSSILCEIKVYTPDEEEKDYEIEKGLKYDIHTFISMELVKVYNPSGLLGVRKGVEIKIKKYLKKIYGLEDNEFYLSFGIKDCGK